MGTSATGSQKRASWQEQAHQQVDFTESVGKPVSFFELLLYTMRHVQEHAAQLNLFLGQHAIDGASDWVSQGKAEIRDCD